MNLEIRGVTYHLEVEGNPATEPTAILLHGFSGSCASARDLRSSYGVLR